ncbi:MAG: YggS family pyridoxal phosphate-dependent enzyme [Proteobacteria bacterium]|nr:YggS family pyridoxal phosphate-dependent enzyme [Candidatus Fonsibacter sp. PEL4]
MKFLQNFKLIKDEINNYSKKTNLIVVTKNQDFSKINYLINDGHKDFGENRMQETRQKWEVFLKNNSKVNLHFIGKLQSNKIKEIGNLFNFIHSLDNIKNAELLAAEEIRSLKKIKYFIQVNLAKEPQKSGIKEEDLGNFIYLCKKNNLNIIGLMCIPPLMGDPTLLFKRLKNLAEHYSLSELSMGMSNDYVKAIQNGATYVRVGSAIFNEN